MLERKGGSLEEEMSLEGQTIDGVVCDLAGTTVKDDTKAEDGSSKPGRVNDAIREALWEKKKIIVTPAEVAAVMGEAKPIAFKKLLLTHLSSDIVAAMSPELVDEIANDLNLFFEDKLMVPFYLNDPSVGEIEDTTPSFERLKQAGKKCALNTGFSRKISDAILKRLGWERKGLIDILVASDEVLRGRPFPDMIDLIRERLKFTSGQLLAKVGDTPVDIREGVNARCALVLAVLTGTGKKAGLEACGAEAIAQAEATGSPFKGRIRIVQNIQEATDDILSFRVSA